MINNEKKSEVNNLKKRNKMQTQSVLFRLPRIIDDGFARAALIFTFIYL